MRVKVAPKGRQPLQICKSYLRKVVIVMKKLKVIIHLIKAFVKIAKAIFTIWHLMSM